MLTGSKVASKMRCISPIPLTQTVGCGQCKPCRVHKRRQWTGRLILESLFSDATYFVTLTYSDDHVPEEFGDLVLHKPDLQNYLKSVWNRSKNGTGTFRQFAVGEYGDTTGRPHYHAAIFSQGDFDPHVLTDAWNYGFVSISNLAVERMAYVCGYTVKKMTKKDDERLEGKPPEFATMSRNPGIGYPAVKALASYYQTASGAKFLAEYGGIIPEFRYNGRLYPLDNFMQSKIYDELGLPVKATDRKRLWSPETHIARWAAEQESRLIPDADEIAKRRNDLFAYEARKKIRQSETRKV